MIVKFQSKIISLNLNLINNSINTEKECVTTFYVLMRKWNAIQNLTEETKYFCIITN